MKKTFFISLPILSSIAACGQQPQYTQNGCPPNDAQCVQQGSTNVQQDHSGTLLAGVAGLGVGAMIGHHLGANAARQPQPYGYHPGYPTQQHYYPPQRTVVVHHYTSNYRPSVVHVYHHR